MTHATVALPNQDNHNLTIVNGYTQYHWRGKGRLADYDAIRSVMRLVKQEFSGKRIAYPKIGCGLAKGDWTIVANIIEQELDGEDHTFVQFSSSQEMGENKMMVLLSKKPPHQEPSSQQGGKATSEQDTTNTDKICEENKTDGNRKCDTDPEQLQNTRDQINDKGSSPPSAE
eukprot:CAMPEP_0168725816 /NCGR_PEP_ID=MMETSP0724-20121128/4350_1 /TAXON_ID=265536 /ORGANISM="Amphiprora sp., Strain CCMP467" /LENGTH=171 /DNA_ID=CAMNT_0008772615 /DNA_START=172 /DNA_END=687 /DNA_ORIENTATION=-